MVARISDALCHARFYGDNPASDEVPLMKILQVRGGRGEGEGEGRKEGERRRERGSGEGRGRGKGERRERGGGREGVEKGGGVGREGMGGKGKDFLTPLPFLGRGGRGE